MNSDSIKTFDILHSTAKEYPLSMLDGEVKEVHPYYYQISESSQLNFNPDKSFCRVFILLEGKASFLSNGKNFNYAERAVFIPDPDETFSIKVTDSAKMIEIRRDLTKIDWEEITTENYHYPFTQSFTNSVQYRESFATLTTVKREIVPQRVLPRLAMGTVETKGPDLLGFHDHPMLDQLFFSFSDNHFTMEMDNVKKYLGGYTLMHIPLGSMHGAHVAAGEIVDYIWMDFTFDSKTGLNYLDSAHKPIK